MKRIILTTALTIIMAACLYAEPISVKLTVVDKYGQPVEGVIISGNKLAGNSVTDISGNAHFASEKGDQITLELFNRYVKKVTVTSNEMRVQMDDNSRILGTGFNEFTTKETSSSAIDGIFTDEDICGSTQDQILGSLYGMLPGLQVSMPSSGTFPDAASPTLTVRGAGSCTNGVLFIVDGVARDASSIDFGEVQSVSVLKDAASLAIYGLRGADGAVIVTTRRGGPQKFRANVDYMFGYQTPYGIPEMASPVEYANALNEARHNDGLMPYFSESDIKGIADGSNTVIPTADWRNLILRDQGYYHKATVTMDGSSDKTRYFIYANFKSNSGFFNNTNLTDGLQTQNQYTSLKLRTNLDVKVTRSTDLAINLSARIQQRQMPYNFSSLQSMYDTPSVGIPVKFNDRWTGTSTFSNPLGTILGKGNSVTFQRMLSGDITIRQDLSSLIKGLSAELRVAYDNSADITDSKSHEYAYYNFSPVYDSQGNLSDYNLNMFGNDTEIGFSSYLAYQYMQFSMWAKLEWERDFGKHHIKSMAMFNRDRRKLTGANNSRVYHDCILGADYSFGGKYLASIVLSGSGGSVLPTGDKYRFFPAASIGWIASKEDFLKGAGFLDFLKIRASYGVSGMDRNLSYDMDKQFNGAGKGFIFISPTISKGAAEGALPSTGIMPETDYKANAGIELRVLNGLSAEIDIFHNTRKHIRTIASNTTSEVIGIGLSDMFTGEMVNRGIEISVGWEHKTGNLKYWAKGNFSYARNTVTHIEEQYSPYSYMYQKGNSRNRFYGLVADGYYQPGDFDKEGNLLPGLPVNSFAAVQPGDVKYKDLNGDNRIDNYDCTFQLKSPYPEIYFGFQFGLEYKGAGFRAFFQGADSYTITTTLRSIYQPLYGNDKNISKHYLESYWSESHPYGRYPRLTTLDNSNNFRPSNLWTVDGGYLKLRELEIYYSFPKDILAKARMTDAKIFIRGNNLFSIDNVKIFDPEYISTGYPLARTFAVGFNMTF